LASLGQIAWCRLTDEEVRFTVIPEKGSQVWSVLRIETIFETYTIQSASEQNAINLEVPIQALTRALKSAVGATSAQLRLTKKDNVPMLSLTIVNNTFSSSNSAVVIPTTSGPAESDEFGDFDFHADFEEGGALGGGGGLSQERETVITQDVPVKVLPMQAVEGLHEPRTPEPDVNIYLPSLQQVKSISERFTRLALATKTASTSSSAPRLELSANMHGSLKIAIRTDALSISSVWTGLVNPELDPANVEGGSQGIRDHPSTKMKALGEDHWAAVRVDAKDFARVLSVGRLGARVIACK
jgi:HUS1 checkpoint protein